ncbi:hypothetical protein GCM10010238_29630 [Streptomyces griseoviridis]|uniref:Uncharacterized protein n=1 Tax=Streptomyces griseoviridis TaxID=45398 RepID=A0A918GI57_STRGD|nr:hypothetical protein GCM10010238_29630 [Streptomyces niveoruber]
MSGSTPAVSIVPSSRRRASGTLAASRRRWSDHQMLMLHQPPGRGSTYRYVLPGVPGRKRGVDIRPPIRRMRPGGRRCKSGVHRPDTTCRTVTFRSYGILWTCRTARVGPVG